MQGGGAGRISRRRCAADPRRELAALLAAEAIDAGLARGMATRVYPACWEGEKPLLGAPLALESLLAQPERAEAAA